MGSLAGGFNRQRPPSLYGPPEASVKAARWALLPLDAHTGHHDGDQPLRLRQPLRRLCCALHDAVEHLVQIRRAHIRADSARRLRPLDQRVARRAYLLLAQRHKRRGQHVLGEFALQMVQYLRRTDPLAHTPSPETAEQVAMVREWL